MRRELDLEALWQSPEPMMSLRDPRHSVLLQARVTPEGGAPTVARIRNISRGGIMAECSFGGSEGDRIGVSLRGLGEVAGSVAWTRRNRIGVMFDEPIDPSGLLCRPRRARAHGCVPGPSLRAWRPALHGPRNDPR